MATATTADANAKTDVTIENEDPTLLFDIVQRIGEGSYGAVYKALDKRDGSMVAVKALAIDTADANTLQKEIHILQSCSSSFVVRYRGSYVKDNDLWIVMEYCLCSMADIMETCGRTLKEPELAVCMRMALEGLIYLHKTKIIHRDVKAGNLLITAAGDIKLADFGVSAELTQTLAKRMTMIGSPYWMAPEILKQMKYDPKVDIWSLGITAYELITSRPPHSELPYMKAIFLIPKNDSPSIPETHAKMYSADCHDFIKQCLQKEPAQRPTAQQLMEHPFIKKSGDKRIIVQLLDECMPKIDANRDNPQPTPAAAGSGSADGKQHSGPIKTGTMPKAMAAAVAAAATANGVNGAPAPAPVTTTAAKPAAKPVAAADSKQNAIANAKPAVAPATKGKPASGTG